MICPECGNRLIHESDSEVCLVCQHTGRGKPVTATEVKACLADAADAERQARGLAAALEATYAALAAGPLTEDVEAKMTVLEAQQMLRHRIRNPEHNRERPDWDEIDADERERKEVCQTCLGTRRYLTLPCPDCSEDGDRERD